MLSGSIQANDLAAFCDILRRLFLYNYTLAWFNTLDLVINTITGTMIGKFYCYIYHF